jgi:hypothetical protein
MMDPHFICQKCYNTNAVPMGGLSDEVLMGKVSVIRPCGRCNKSTEHVRETAQISFKRELYT